MNGKDLGMNNTLRELLKEAIDLRFLIELGNRRNLENITEDVYVKEVNGFYLHLCNIGCVDMLESILKEVEFGIKVEEDKEIN